MSGQNEELYFMIFVFSECHGARLYAFKQLEKQEYVYLGGLNLER